MWLGTGNVDPCSGNWQLYATGKSPRPSATSGPPWDFATIVHNMYKCMRISGSLSTRCYRWASSIVAREAGQNVDSPCLRCTWQAQCLGVVGPCSLDMHCVVLAWTTEAEGAFDKLTERLLGGWIFSWWSLTRDSCSAQMPRTML